MSSMLEEAIIDAEALKEAARKSAEEKIIEHFSKDIKEAVNVILEQDLAALDPAAALVPGMGTTMAPTTPYIPQTTDLASDSIDQGLIDIEAEGSETRAGESIVKQAPFAATTSDKDVVSIDLNKLEESIRQEMKDYDEDGNLIEEDVDIYELDETFDFNDDLLEEDEGEETCPEGHIMMDGKCIKDTPPGKEDAGIKMEESIKEMIASILKEEGMPYLRDEDAAYDRDWREEAPPSSLVNEKTLDEEAAAAGLDKWQTEMYKKLVRMYPEADRAALVATVREEPENPTEEAVPPATGPGLREHQHLINKTNFLKEQLDKYKEVFPQLKQQLEESNLQNARLHYQNRVLNSTSLNERQKDRLVETISKANTVEEAKIIYETLQSAVGASAPTRRPKSLNEVVTKSSSAFMPRKEEKRVDPLKARMKALAGITDK